MVVRYFPGYQFESNYNTMFGNSSSHYQYSGFGGTLSMRFLNSRVPGLALTVSGGAISFFKPTDGSSVNPTSVEGFTFATSSTLGGDPNLRDFFVFPISAGIQGMWPFEGYDKFRVFAGVEASGYFIDGSLAPRAQTRIGYSVAGGIGIGMVDIGARYSQFADMRNLGVFLGLCMKFYEF